MYTDHVLQGTANEEILLLQAQLLPLNGLIVRIEDLCDVLCHHLVVDSAVVVTHIKLLKVEGFTCFRFPQAQGIGGVYLITKDSHIVGNTFYHLRRNTAHPIPALIVSIWFFMTAAAHLGGL